MNNIEEIALAILNTLSDHHYESYIVGGYVRDKILGITSNDIDICTSATPKEIMEIFPNTSSPNYGSININYKNTNFDITTFRKDIKYKDNRTPVKIRYIKSIKRDLKRRDFTINTLCIDKKGKIRDYLNATPDLNNHVIKTVGNPKHRLKEDSLRILRAIRFATILDFEIEKNTKLYLQKYGYLLENLSYQRKKEELDKIFMSKNKEKGITLLIDLGLSEYLKLPKLNNIVPCSDLLGIWAQLDVDDIYPFTKTEKEGIKKIKELLSLNTIDTYNLYKYGLYTSTVVSQIKKESISKLNKKYNQLPIKERKEIQINGEEILSILEKDKTLNLKLIIEDIEKKIVLGTLPNNKKEIKKYILKKYKTNC